MSFPFPPVFLKLQSLVHNQYQHKLQITSSSFLNKLLSKNVILVPSTTSMKCRQDAQQSVRAGIELESRYEGMTNMIQMYSLIH